MLLFAVAVLLQFSRALDDINNTFYDRLLVGLTSQPADDIVIVAIDEASLAQLGRWPWSRAVHARLLDRLIVAAVSSIGFNLIFAEPDNDSQADQALV